MSRDRLVEELPLQWLLLYVHDHSLSAIGRLLTNSQGPAPGVGGVPPPSFPGFPGGPPGFPGRGGGKYIFYARTYLPLISV